MFPSSFAFQPRPAYSQIPLHIPAPHFNSPSADTDFDFDAYDAHRNALEQRALAAKQQERRAAEAAALRRHDHLIEVERRQRQQEALYEALAQRQAEEEAYAAAVEQHRRREQARIAAAREAAYVAEVQRRRAISATAQAQAQAQEHHRRLAAQQAHREAHQRESELIHPLQFFFQQLLDVFNDTSESTKPDTTSAPLPLPVPSFAAPTLAPAAEPIEATSETSAPVEDESTSDAATTLQRHFRAHLARRTALAELATLSSSLDSHQSAFTAPPSLVFQPSPPSSSTDGKSSPATPKLAYSPVNAPFLAFEDFLVGLLTKVDAVQSGGDRVVKTARKDLVRRIEQELRRLDERKDGEWEKLSASTKSADQDVEMSDGESDFSGASSSSC